MKRSGLLFTLSVAIIACSCSPARLVFNNDQPSQSILPMPDRIESRQQFISGSANSVPKAEIELIRLEFFIHCTQAVGDSVVPHQDLKVNQPKTVEGMASWYGKEFHGKEMASSTSKKKRVFNMYALTAACKSFPMGSTVRVKNIKNGRTVIVQITDYGPNNGRLIDLSLKAFESLGIDRDKGLVRVQVSSL